MAFKFVNGKIYVLYSSLVCDPAWDMTVFECCNKKFLEKHNNIFSVKSDKRNVIVLLVLCRHVITIERIVYTFSDVFMSDT